MAAILSPSQAISILPRSRQTGTKRLMRLFTQIENVRMRHFYKQRFLWLQEKYKGKLQLKLFPSCSVSTVSVFPPWTTEFLEGKQRILNSFILWFLLWALWKDWKSEEMYHKTISDSSQFFILAFYFSDCKWIEWLCHPGQEWKRRLIPGLRGG